jgi:hypothetical protein
LRAVRTALALLSLVSEHDFVGHRLRLRIGVATGPVAAGAVGGAERQTYTLYGDTVFDLWCEFFAASSDIPDAVAIGNIQVRGRN